MADHDDKKGRSKPFWLIVVLLLTQFLVFVSVLSPESLVKTINQELEMMVDVYGIEAAQRIYDRSLDTSDEWLYQSGSIEGIRNLLLPAEYLEDGFVTDTKIFNTNFWSIVDNSIHNLALSVEFSLLRVYSMTQWLVLAVIMLIASVCSGLLFREIKKHGFEYSSPLRHGLSRKLLYFMPVIIYIMMVVPLSIHPYFYPLLVSMLCVSFAFYASNTIKRV